MTQQIRETAGFPGAGQGRGQDKGTFRKCPPPASRTQGEKSGGGGASASTALVSGQLEPSGASLFRS